jgi:CrcB protein
VLAWVGARLAATTTAASFWPYLLGTGFCGALTTFSALQVETLTLAQDGHTGVALIYASASLAAGMALATAVTVLTRRRRSG